ncbi:MAG: TerB family tellurite resistance protein [Elusimicrobia bacterium]|nr:TerB family tellurite resistance protein [Elusimicrobiota bacterium]
MGNWSKFIGAGLGWALGGPIGAVAGYFIAGAVDQNAGGEINNPANRGNIVFTNIIAFMALIVKADNKIRESEKKQAMDTLSQMFRLDYQDLALSRQMFEKFLSEHIDVNELCAGFNNVADKDMKIVVMEVLFKIALSDMEFHPSEERLIEDIAEQLGFSEYEIRSMKVSYASSHGAGAKSATGSQDIRRYYDTLEIPYSASLDEIKKAYRKLMLKYHPDRFADIDPVARELINAKAAEINEAYDKVLSAKQG